MQEIIRNSLQLARHTIDFRGREPSDDPSCRVRCSLEHAPNREGPAWSTHLASTTSPTHLEKQCPQKPWTECVTNRRLPQTTPTLPQPSHKSHRPPTQSNQKQSSTTATRLAHTYRRLQEATLQKLVWPPRMKDALFGRQSGNHEQISTIRRSTHTNGKNGGAQRPHLQTSEVPHAVSE